MSGQDPVFKDPAFEETNVQGTALKEPILNVQIHLPLSQFQLDCCFQAGPEVVVLFGHSGSGKTSVLDCIAGFRRPQQGRIDLGGRTLFRSQNVPNDAANGAPNDLAKKAQGKDAANPDLVNIPVRHRRIGYLSQQPALFPHLTVRQNVAYGLLDLPASEREARVEAILARFRIQALASNRPAAISGGEQQRVALARTLVCDPQLLLLDEPLSALDLALKSLLLDVLFDWQRERAVGVLYVTHDQSEAFSLSRRVLVMEKGRIVADGEPRQVFDAPLRRENALLSGYENIFDAMVEEVHPGLGTMTCRIAGSGLLLESPLAKPHAGEAASLAVRAGDILIAVNRPSGLSARNILSGRIRTIADIAGMAELRVRCTPEPDASPSDVAGTDFCVHITRGALQSLALQPGMPVWIIIKTHSIQFLRN